MEERTKVVIYARVSTSAQDYTRQITELRKHAKKQNYEIVKEFSEKISGGKKIEERAAISPFRMSYGIPPRSSYIPLFYRRDRLMLYGVHNRLPSSP